MHDVNYADDGTISAWCPTYEDEAVTRPYEGLHLCGLCGGVVLRDGA